MQQVQTLTVQDGPLIPALTHEEAMTMSAEELRRFVALIESLSGEDWNQQTACSLWTVKDIIAHQAAHVTGFTSIGSLMGQFSPVRLFPYLRKGMNSLDAWNQSEVDRRRQRTPAEVIAEIRNALQASLEGRKRIPGFLRAITLPLPGLDQARSFGYIFDLIYTRDMWMHRLDICNATGRKMVLDATHDGRIVALIVRDLAEKSTRGLNGRPALLDLTGTAGGRYQIGGSTPPAATIEIDTLRFCILTSGREKAANVLKDARISGDVEFGRHVLNFSENRVLY